MLFLDDDVVATEGLLQRHLDHHRRHPEESEALVGLVTWAPELDITPHMLWLEDGGPLFSFNTIDDPEDVDWHHFCTANVLGQALLPPPDPFDEDLRRCVDIELGYRLSQRGMRLRYDARAVGHHLRVDTPATTEARMREVGRAMRQVHAKHPELVEPPPPFTALSHVKAAAARPGGPRAAAARLVSAPGAPVQLPGRPRVRARLRRGPLRERRRRAGERGPGADRAAARRSGARPPGTPCCSPRSRRCPCASSPRWPRAR